MEPLLMDGWRKDGNGSKMELWCFLSLFLILSPLNLEGNLSASSRGKKRIASNHIWTDFQLSLVSVLSHSHHLSVALKQTHKYFKLAATANEPLPFWCLLCLQVMKSVPCQSCWEKGSKRALQEGSFVGRSLTENRAKHFYVFQKCLMYPLTKLRWHKVTLI